MRTTPRNNGVIKITLVASLLVLQRAYYVLIFIVFYFVLASSRLLQITLLQYSYKLEASAAPPSKRGLLFHLLEVGGGKA
jgi:hypothetical protein